MKKYIILLLIIIATAVITHCTYNYMTNKAQTTTKCDTIVITKYDTLYLTKYEKVKPRIIEVLKRDTIFKTDTFYIAPQRFKLHFNDSLKLKYYDTPIQPTLKYYAQINTQDTTTHIENFQATLYNIPTRTEYITKTITKTKRFNHGIQLGIGYGLINHKPDVYIGYGLQYNFK